MSDRKASIDRQLTVILRDVGYRVEGKLIIQNGIRGHTSDQIWGHCRDLMDAAEQLAPIVKDEYFSKRLQEIQTDPDKNLRVLDMLGVN